MCGESQIQIMCKYWETVVLTLKPKVTYGNKSMINEYKVVNDTGVLSCISDSLVFSLSVNGLVMPNNLL